MDHDTILALTGGLPPSAFDLPDEGVSEDMASPSNKSHLWHDYYPEYDIPCQQDELAPFAYSDLQHELPDLNGPQIQSEYSNNENLEMQYDIPTNVTDMFVIGPDGFSLDPDLCPKDDSANRLQNREKFESHDPCSSIGKSKRFRVTEAVRKVLDAQFLLEPNPSVDEVTSIAKKVRMSTQQVRTWFRNKRRRTTPEDIARARQRSSTDSLLLTDDSLNSLQDELDANIENSYLQGFEVPTPYADFRYDRGGFRVAKFRNASPGSIVSSQQARAASRMRYRHRSSIASTHSFRSIASVLHQDFSDSLDSPLDTLQGTGHWVDGDRADYWCCDHLPLHDLAFGSSANAPPCWCLDSGSSIGSPESIEQNPAQQFPLGQHRSCSSMSSLNSVGSSSHRVSKSGHASPGRRNAKKGRRLWKKTPRLLIKTTTELKTYHCTFCWESFDLASSWRRHEQEQHFQRTTWLCNPGVEVGHKPDECPYCTDDDLLNCPLQQDLPHPLAVEEHLAAYRHQECVARHECQRTFYRRAHLLQHMKIFHRVMNISQRIISTWRRDKSIEAYHGASSCPFCEEDLQSWQERTQHMIMHFESFKMKSTEDRRQILLDASHKGIKHRPISNGLRDSVCSFDDESVSAEVQDDFRQSCMSY